MKSVSKEVSTLLRDKKIVEASVQARGYRVRGPFDVVCDVVFDQAFTRVRYQVRIQVEGELWKT